MGRRKRYGRATGRSKAGRFKAAVKKIVLGEAETKRRATNATHGLGTALTVGGLAVQDDPGVNGLWLNSTAAANTLSRPDTALAYPPNCIFGAIAKGDDSNEREGDKVDLIRISNRYTITITWGSATANSQPTQQLNCLEFLLCIKDPATALAMAVDMDTAGNDYNNNVMRILTAAGLFAQQYTNTEILANTPATNALSNEAIWQKDAIFGVKQWRNDMSADDVAERTVAKSLGSVIWKRWRTFRRPITHLSRVVDSHNSGIPLTGTGQVAVFELGVDVGDATIPTYHTHEYETRSRHKMGVAKRFKKPVKLIYNIAADGSETTASLPTNKCFIYGTWWISDMATAGSVDVYQGTCEMRWKDP